MVIADCWFIPNLEIYYTIQSPKFKIKIDLPPARLERATHSLAYLTWFPKPCFSEEKQVESLDYILDISVWVRVVSTEPL